jgi:hypothetical protein
MAILLIIAQEANVIESPSKWKQGMVVGIFPDNHSFGLAEVPPKFWKIKVTGVTTLDLLSLITKNTIQDPLLPSAINIVRRRLNKIDHTQLNPTQINALNSGIVTINKATLDKINTRIN